MTKHVPDPTRELAFRIEAGKELLSSLREVAGEDEDFLADLIEGQTDVLDIINRIDAAELEDRTEITGLESTIDMLGKRKERAEKRAETKRSVMAAALDKIGLTKHRTPLGTISVSAKAPIAMVIEESDIPTRFWKAQAPKLDKAGLNDAWKARSAAMATASAIDDLEERRAATEAAEREHPAIPGTTLSNGGVRINIRR